MVTFSNNHNGRWTNFRRGDSNFKNNGDRSKFSSTSSNNDNFQRKAPGRNNHNAPKLIEKYNNLAREALSSGDKILSENYFQHADHFTRILKEKEIQKKANLIDKDSSEDKSSIETITKKTETLDTKEVVKSEKNQSEVS